MLSNDRKRITLIHPVRVNHQMLKHIKPTKEEQDMDYNDYLNSSFVELTDSWLSSTSTIWDGIPFAMRRKFDTKFMTNLADVYIKTRLFFMKQFGKTKHTDEEFFCMVKSSMKELEVIPDEEKEIIQKELAILFQTKQKAIYKDIVRDLEVKNAEEILFNNGLKKYQREEDIINFITKTKAGLCLIEVENFKFEIPEDVREKMIKADELRVFDNFYVLFTDPDYDNSKVKFTEQKEKDPILFGVIKNSTKLYYVGDWLSDYCKLTYDVLLMYNCDHELKSNIDLKK